MANANLQPVLDHIDADFDNSLARLFYLLRIKSISADPAYNANVRDSAETAAARMRAAHEGFLGRAWRGTDSVAFFETNAAFHLGLAQASGNRFLVQAVEQQNQLRLFYNYDYD